MNAAIGSIGAAALGLAACLAVGVATWLASLPLRKASVVDAVWSWLVLLPALVCAGVLGAGSPRALLVLALGLAWAARLSGFVVWRNWDQPEDRRYQRIRARNEPGFAWKSLYLVFGLQALLAWIVSTPLMAAVASERPIGWLDAPGAALVLLGIVFEALADWQLARFRARRPAPGAVMDGGLWRYTRHPNYFGEFLLWWGFYAMAAAAGGAWSIVSPLLMTVLLLKVSGVTLLEADLSERKPEYRNYVARTNAFFPGPVRR
jgi:steroid 5-alpha reductase family enzyme